ncbi:MAG: hypothetical protein RIM99_04865 [Cyclobacteriaceae bacterium]
MIRTLLLFASTLTILFGCSEESAGPFIDVNPDAGIDLQNIQSGNSASYVLYDSQCDQNFQFTGDTLVISVIEKNDSLFLREQYTEGSYRERTIEHVIIPKNGYVLIPDRFSSEFLFFYGNDTIFLDRPATVDLVQNGCQLMENGDTFIGDAIGSIDKFEFGTMRIINKKGISCVPGNFEIDAYIFYSDHLSAVHIINNGLNGQITGFMAIE